MRFLFYIVAVYGFLYIPIVLVVLSSFSTSGDILHWSGVSFCWYRKLFCQREIIDAAYFSFRVAFVSASISSALGLLCAYLLVNSKRSDSWHHNENNTDTNQSLKEPKSIRLLNVLSMAPLLVSEIVLGLAFLLAFNLFSNWGFAVNPMHRLVIAHITLGCAYTVSILKASLLSVDKSIEEAALDLGAKPHHVFIHVTLPIISRALLVSWLMAFLISMDDVIIASFLHGSGVVTLPLLIFSRLKFGVTPDINALASILIFMAISVSVVVWRVMKNDKQRDVDN
jgi:putrescine transport system permease protein